MERGYFIYVDWRNALCTTSWQLSYCREKLIDYFLTALYFFPILDYLFSSFTWWIVKFTIIIDFPALARNVSISSLSRTLLLTNLKLFEDCFFCCWINFLVYQLVYSILFCKIWMERSTETGRWEKIFVTAVDSPIPGRPTRIRGEQMATNLNIDCLESITLMNSSFSSLMDRYGD